jgi:hypothetical protein
VFYTSTAVKHGCNRRDDRSCERSR